MKNCAVAECGLGVRAIATVPAVFFNAFCASFAIGSRVFFCSMAGVNPPP